MLIDDPETRRRVEERWQKLAQQEQEAQQRYAESYRRVREWAVCPQLYTPPELAGDGQSYLQVQWFGPKYFPTENDALSYHCKHPGASLAPVPVTHGPIKGPQFDGRRFAAFFPIDRAKGPQLSHPTLLTSERTQQEECIGCAIDPKGRWRIATIVNGAALGLGHTIGGFENPLQALLSGAHDLERTLFAAHPDISADAVIDFWTSFEVHEAIQHHAARIEDGYSVDQVRIALVILRQQIDDYVDGVLEVGAEASGVPETDHGLSDADRGLIEILGEEKIRILTNKQLWEMYRFRVKRESGKEQNGFRAAVNRIRAAKGLPSSEELRQQARKPAEKK